MLQPKRTKFRKMQKGRVRGLAQRGSSIAYGTFAIKTTDMGFITSRQIESARIAINRYMKREGQVWIRIFPDKPITSSHSKCVWVRVRERSATGWPLSSLDVCFSKWTEFPQIVAQEALRLGAQKLSVRCRFVARYNN